MGFWVYPDNYEVPDPPSPKVLTTEQRDYVKGRLQTYITNQNKPVWSNDLVNLAQDRLLSQYNILVDEEQLEAIVAEILAEWGIPNGS